MSKKGGEKMSTDAKRKSNARYNGKFKMVALRIPNDQVEYMTAAATAAGESLAGYALKATRERMARDGFQPPDVDDSSTGGG